MLVNDQQSQDSSREIGRRFPKVVWIDSAESQICEQARWRLWDIARQYDGSNLLWCTDADELVSPRLASQFIQQSRLAAGTVIDCLYCHSWNGPTRYRTGLGQYTPYWKPVAIVGRPACELRPITGPAAARGTRADFVQASTRVRAEGVPILHLQWLLPNRSQMRQAWYRCREWIHGGRSAAAINDFYSMTLPAWYVQTAPIPRDWLEGVTLPSTAIDAEPSWQEAEIIGWFNERGVEFFEPLEIWHVPALRAEFRRRLGRNPKPDRSYMPPWPDRARRLSKRVFHAVRRRIIP